MLIDVCVCVCVFYKGHKATMKRRHSKLVKSRPLFQPALQARAN